MTLLALCSLRRRAFCSLRPWCAVWSSSLCSWCVTCRTPNSSCSVTTFPSSSSWPCSPSPMDTWRPSAWPTLLSESQQDVLLCLQFLKPHKKYLKLMYELMTNPTVPKKIWFRKINENSKNRFFLNKPDVFYSSGRVVTVCLCPSGWCALRTVRQPALWWASSSFWVWHWERHSPSYWDNWFKGLGWTDHMRLYWSLMRSLSSLKQGKRSTNTNSSKSTLH